MKRIIALFLVVALAAVVAPAFAAQGAKGASATAMEKASDEAIFHRVGDWFATRGKTPEEAQAIRAARKAERQKKLMEKQLRKSQKEMKGQVKKGWGK